MTPGGDPIHFNQVSGDALGEFDTSTGRFTVAQGGVYLICGSLDFSSNGLQVQEKTWAITIVVDRGAGLEPVARQVHQQNNGGGPILPVVSVTCSLTLDVGDTVQLAGIASDSPRLQGSAYDYLTIVRLRDE